ncbi:MAG TPA: D-Ala-D-Ala carboxypeptidase family metallohydrolase [Thermoanaerobaculia bacterium]|nr:D-Ala-D-Ala carboxypeptidase family metallohydrolase [Thermoanaerobaculia bacterium]
MRPARRSFPLPQLALCLLLAALAGGRATAKGPRFMAWQPDRAGFTVLFRGEATHHTLLGVFVLPGETLPLEVARQDLGAGSYALEAPAGTAVEPAGAAAWRWTAPAASGLYPITIHQRPSGRTMTLNVFVMVPASEAKRGEINGYRLGSYPAEPFRDLPEYLPPRGFIEVTEALRDARVAPHFTLAQFLCRQESGFPKYVALRERLVLKLEMILEAVNASGNPADTLHIQSGYRTPHHNHTRSRGRYSRHIYGDAADLFVDQDRNGRMDDLDGNGRLGNGDADALRWIVEGIDDRPTLAEYVGGLGFYRGTHSHGPYLHVDTRGYVARWGS